MKRGCVFCVIILLLISVSGCVAETVSETDATPENGGGAAIEFSDGTVISETLLAYYNYLYPEDEDKALSEAVLYEFSLKMAENYGICLSDEEISQLKESFLGNNRDDESGISATELAEFYVGRCIINRLYSRLAEEVSVNTSELEEYYKEHEAEYFSVTVIFAGFNSEASFESVSDEFYGINSAAEMYAYTENYSENENKDVCERTFGLENEAILNVLDSTEPGGKGVLKTENVIYAFYVSEVTSFDSGEVREEIAELLTEKKVKNMICEYAGKFAKEKGVVLQED